MKPEIGFILSDPDARIPQFETAGAAGADMHAVIRDDKGEVNVSGIELRPMQRHLFKTGLHLDIPDGFEVQIRPRSGLAYKHGITVLNSPGTIDSDYRGEIGVLLINLGSEEYFVHHGDRISQMVVAPVTSFDARETQGISESERGRGGFGSTGK